MPTDRAATAPVFGETKRRRTMYNSRNRHNLTRHPIARRDTRYVRMISRVKKTRPKITSRLSRCVTFALRASSHPKSHTRLPTILSVVNFTNSSIRFKRSPRDILATSTGPETGMSNESTTNNHNYDNSADAIKLSNGTHFLGRGS